MVKIYYDEDADLGILTDKTIAIIGYGIQGRGQSLCLRDSGCRVIVSEIAGTPNFEQAKQDGFSPLSAEEAAGKDVKDVELALSGKYRHVRLDFAERTKGGKFELCEVDIWAKPAK